MFAILFVIFDGLIQYFFGVNIFGYEYDGYRLGLFNDTKFFGYYLVRLLPILFAIGIYFYSDSIINNFIKDAFSDFVPISPNKVAERNFNLQTI